MELEPHQWATSDIQRKTDNLSWVFMTIFLLSRMLYVCNVLVNVSTISLCNEYCWSGKICGYLDSNTDLSLWIIESGAISAKPHRQAYLLHVLVIVEHHLRYNLRRMNIFTEGALGGHSAESFYRILNFVLKLRKTNLTREGQAQARPPPPGPPTCRLLLSISHSPHYTEQYLKDGETVRKWRWHCEDTWIEMIGWVIDVMRVL